MDGALSVLPPLVVLHSFHPLQLGCITLKNWIYSIKSLHHKLFCFLKHGCVNIIIFSPLNTLPFAAQKW